MLFLTLVSSLISTELGVASAPAPTVVGMAIQGSVLSGSDTRPSKSAAVGPGEKNKPATALAASMGLPPPRPMIRSQALSRASCRASSTIPSVGSGPPGRKGPPRPRLPAGFRLRRPAPRWL